MTTRRRLLTSIATGTVAVAGGTGVASARWWRGEDPASVRVIHASPDAPAVDVFVEGDAVLEGVPFGAISDYLSLPAGEYDVAVAPTGAGADAAVIETTLPVEADAAYTVAATGELADIQPTVFEDDRDPFPPSEERIRAVHLSPDAPAVDVALTDGPGIRDPLVVAESLSFRGATDYLDLLPTGYSVAIRPAGTDQAVLELDADLASGQTLSLFVVGLLDPASDDQALDVVVAEDVAPLRERARGRARD